MKKINLLAAALLGIGITTAQAQIGLVYSTNQIISAPVTIVGGTIYCSTTEGGGSLKGNVFSIDTTGGGYADLHDFSGTDGYGPTGPLTVSGNTVYGVTRAGGTSDSGVVYSVGTNGSGFTVLHSFTGADGSFPLGGVVLIGNTLYGTTEYGGAHQEGVLFSINTNGSGYTDLHDFTPTPGGSEPMGALVAINGMLYGETSQGAANRSGNIFSYNTVTQTYTDLYDLNAQSDGYLLPIGSNLYSMTNGGGANGDGYIFYVDTNGTGFKDIYDFTTTTFPSGALTLSGTTFYGCDGDDGPYGDGFLFALDTNGSGYKEFYNFNGSYGEDIIGSFVMLKGTLYGTAAAGGPQFGTIFKFGSDTNNATGISQLAISTGISVYPNPSNGIFNFTASGTASQSQSTVEIYNMLGEKVYSQLTNNQSQFTINLSGQPAGVYLYRIIDEAGSLTGEGRIAIQK